MTQYFYDDEADLLVAYDRDAQTVRALTRVGGVDAKEAEGPREHPARMIAKRGPAAPSERDRNAQSGKSKGGCPECGSPSRHKKDCSRARINVKPFKTAKTSEGTQEWKALGEVDAPKTKMSRMTFGRVKISQSHDIPVETVARNIDEPESEVEKAFDADSYDEYINL